MIQAHILLIPDIMIRVLMKMSTIIKTTEIMIRITMMTMMKMIMITGMMRMIHTPMGKKDVPGRADAKTTKM